MLRNRIYYQLKPWLPWRLRLGVRRWLARRQRRRFADQWPILEEAGQAPENWPGWPEGRQFALVLTHDVEGAAGVDKVRPLAQMEAELGFRSSFNFVPEGAYQTPPELRAWLTAQGFEVGVHDLHHDGKLYQSRAGFRAKAARINQHLKEWGAVGFRSGLMLHNLDWLKDLEVLYDASTFDTDPFEPQPDGVRTIFPFWVSGGRAAAASSPAHAFPERGYVELPYTLPQDSTLFLLLRERTIDIWKQKLAWIARCGGMALLNVHPDYVRLPGEPPSAHTFDVGLYREFLEHVCSEYAGRYWHVLPRELAARFDRQSLPHRSGASRRIAMVTASVYERDNRVLRYAEALATRGDAVEVFALKDTPQSPRTARLRGVQVFRSGRKRSSRAVSSQLVSVLGFFLVAAARLSGRHLRRRYDLIHVHNMPDFLVFSAWLPRLCGVPVVLDIHDLFPEFYASRSGRGADGAAVQWMRRLERWCCRFASHVIVSNHLWRETLVGRSVPPERCSVFINSVDEQLFRPRTRGRTDGAWVILYPGSFNHHQGLDVAIQALPLVRRAVPAAELHLYGAGPVREQLKALAAELQLNGAVRFFEPLPLDRMPQVLADADVGVVPKRASDFFGNQAFSTKIMEFMSQGLPVVVADTEVDRFYYQPSEVRFFASENVEALAEALVEVARDAALRERLAANGRAYVARNSWATRRPEYLQLVDSLIARTARA
jgi:glycosyltransferase involved in cell wall biosynthesis